MKLRILAVLVAIAPSIPRPSGACSPLPEDDGAYLVDPAHAADTTPPRITEVTHEVTRSFSDSGGCAADCGGGSIGWVELSLSATDDASPSHQLGYTVEIVGGQPPSGGLGVRSSPVRAIDQGDEPGLIRLRFDPHAGPFTVDLEVTPVDLGGNIGTPVVVTIEG